MILLKWVFGIREEITPELFSYNILVHRQPIILILRYLDPRVVRSLCRGTWNDCVIKERYEWKRHKYYYKRIWKCINVAEINTHLRHVYETSHNNFGVLLNNVYKQKKWHTIDFAVICVNFGSRFFNVSLRFDETAQGQNHTFSQDRLPSGFHTLYLVLIQKISSVTDVHVDDIYKAQDPKFIARIHDNI